MPSNAARAIQAQNRFAGGTDLELRRTMEGRLYGLRVNRYSWWTHWRELGDYYIPRRYKWLITPNQMSRGSPINQHILDFTPGLCGRDLAAGIMSGICSPTSQWFQLMIGRTSSAMTGPTAEWLSQIERILMLVFQESNFYNAIATLLFDLVIFGTGVMIIYPDFENVIACYNPCAGEYYLEASDKFHPDTMYREFTFTVSQTVQKFGLENCSPWIQQMWQQGSAQLTREIIVAHAIEPNSNPRKYGIPSHFKWRECYWEWGGSASPQGGASYSPGFLSKKGYYEQPFMAPRWDLVANDAYGRSPAMDGLGDAKQLQLEVKRKAQAIDKLVNPPMIADLQMKNQPASLLPGGVTYIAGLMSQPRPGFAPVYQVAPPVQEISEDLQECRERLKQIFFIPLFKTISQYETRSNVTASEIDARRAEALVMLGPVLDRLQNELLAPALERTLAIGFRSGIFPPAPSEIQGHNINIKYISILSKAQQANAASGIERMFQLAGQVAGLDPAIVDNIDFDYGFDKMSSLLNNDPKLIRSPQQLAQIRQMRQQAQQQQQQMEQSSAMVEGAKNLAGIDVGGGKNALQQMTGLS
jgi:hypothetical protein